MSAGDLYDWLTTGPLFYQLSEGAVKGLAKAVVYEISNVATLCATYENIPEVERYSRVAPPFEETWFEYDLLNIYDKDELARSRFSARDIDTIRGRKVGILFIAKDIRGIPVEHRAAAFTQGLNPSMAQSGTANELVKNMDWASVRWATVADMFIFRPGETESQGVRVFEERVFPFISDTGAILTPLGMSFSRRFDRQCADKGTDAITFTHRLLLPLLESLMLLNCKNVISDAISPPYSRQMRRRNEPVKVSYRVIKIVPMKEYLRYKRQGIPIPAKLIPYHMVPGKLRDYTEHGLFGKWKGCYYWHPHARGSMRAGTIVKDYRVTA